MTHHEFVLPSGGEAKKDTLPYESEAASLACNANASMTFKPIEEILPNEQTW